MITSVPWFILLFVAVAFSGDDRRRQAAPGPAVAERRSIPARDESHRLPPGTPADKSGAPLRLRAVAQTESASGAKARAAAVPTESDAAEVRSVVSSDTRTKPVPEAFPAVENTSRVPRLAGSRFRIRSGQRADAAAAGSEETVVQAATLQPAAVYPVRTEILFFPARIDGRDYQLEAKLYRPDDAGRHALVVFSHGRNGMYPARDPNTVNWYGELCNALAAEGHVVAYIVRRGYGNSDGPDSELQDTALLSGLEGAKDYVAAVAYWRTMDFVLPDRVVVMGQSQGGWVTLACTNVAMEGVIGAVNISGGTNYRLMGTGAVTSSVQDHWVAACSQLGAHAVVSSYWIYSENDLSISGPTARRMYEAFTAAGGAATLLMLPPFGTNGHGIVGQPDLFLAPLNDYLATIGFGDQAYSAPTVGPVTGAESVTLGGTATLTAEVSGFPFPALQWRKDGVNLGNGGDIAGATTATLQLANLELADAGSYTLAATNLLGTAVSAAAVVQFPISAPRIQTQPQSQTVTSGASARYSVAVVGNPPPTLQWQRLPAGSTTWSDLAEGGGYAGVTGATLTVSAPTAAMSGDQFRCTGTNSAGSTTSNAGTLTVHAAAAETPAPVSGGGGGESPWLVGALALLAGARRDLICRRAGK
jgi:dienelactone hydrolase